MLVSMKGCGCIRLYQLVFRELYLKAVLQSAAPGSPKVYVPFPFSCFGLVILVHSDKFLRRANESTDYGFSDTLGSLPLASQFFLA